EIVLAQAQADGYGGHDLEVQLVAAPHKLEHFGLEQPPLLVKAVRPMVWVGPIGVFTANLHALLQVDAFRAGGVVGCLVERLGVLFAAVADVATVGFGRSPSEAFLLLYWALEEPFAELKRLGYGGRRDAKVGEVDKAMA